MSESRLHAIERKLSLFIVDKRICSSNCLFFHCTHFFNLTLSVCQERNYVGKVRDELRGYFSKSIEKRK